jgi:GntR family transcriptional regulator
VRRAVADLEVTGLLQKRAGRGTFVTADLLPMRQSATLSFVDSMRKTQNETETVVLVVEDAAPPIDIAEQLDLIAGAKCVHAIRLRKSAQTTVMVTEAWVRGKARSSITRQALQDYPIYDVLTAHGIQFGRVVQEITAIAASAVFAEHLGVVLASPLIKISRLLYDTEQHPVMHLNIYMSPELSRVVMDFPIKEMNTLAAGSIFHDLARYVKR